VSAAASAARARFVAWNGRTAFGSPEAIASRRSVASESVVTGLQRPSLERLERRQERRPRVDAACDVGIAVDVVEVVAHLAAVETAEADRDGDARRYEGHDEESGTTRHGRHPNGSPRGGLG
jgi:hypothetical protein